MPELWIAFLGTKSSFLVDRFFLNSGTVVMLEKRDYHADDISNPSLYGFTVSVTRYTNSLNMNAVHTTFSSLMSRVTSNSWRRAWQSTKLKALGVGLYYFENEFEEFSSAIHTSGV